MSVGFLPIYENCKDNPYYKFNDSEKKLIDKEYNILPDIHKFKKEKKLPSKSKTKSKTKI